MLKSFFQNHKKIKKYALVLLLALSSSVLWSQNYKYGKVSKAELEEKFHPTDTSAHAAVLYSERKITYQYNKEEGFYILEKHFTRLKIYTPEGYDKATQEITSFHNQNGEEKIMGLKARTFNLENGKIVKTKLEKKNIFKEEKNKFNDLTKFTMPNLKPGSVVEWKYELHTPFIGMLDKVVLQDDIPIKKIKVRIATPEFFVYKTQTTGFIHIPIKTELKQRKVSYTSIGREGFAVTRSKNKKTSFTFQENIQLIEMSKVPALKEEFRSGNINNYKAGIAFELSYTKYPNSPLEHYATDWESVVKKIFFSSSFGDQLKKQNHFKEEADQLLEGKSSITDRVFTIFQFVKSKIKWNNLKGYHTDQGVKKAYKKGVGNVADINLNLVAMLQYAGLDADPVLVSTVNNGVPIFPTRYGFNYVIAKVNTPNGYLLLDATEKNALPNILPERVLNFQGRVVSKDGKSDWIRLYPSKHAIKNTVINAKFKETGIKGTARRTLTGNLLLNYRDVVRGKSKESLLEWLDGHYSGIEVLNARVTNLDKLGKDGVETIQFEMESFYDEIAGKIYFSPFLYTQITENPLKSEKREFPVFYDYPRAYINKINITIPETYTIESLPEKADFLLPEEMGIFSYRITKNGQTIILDSKLLINEPVIPTKHYIALKEFFKNMIEKQAEKVVLVKK